MDRERTLWASRQAMAKYGTRGETRWSMEEESAEDTTTLAQKYMIEVINQPGGRLVNNSSRANTPGEMTYRKVDRCSNSPCDIAQ